MLLVLIVYYNWDREQTGARIALFPHLLELGLTTTSTNISLSLETQYQACAC